jgi:hypothetical protein
MPVFVIMLLGGLVQIAGSLAGRVLLSLGFGIAQYAGVSVTLTWLKDQALSSLTGMSADLIGLLAYMKVGESISIIFSALGVALLLRGLSAGGTISKLVIK